MSEFEESKVGWEAAEGPTSMDTISVQTHDEGCQTILNKNPDWRVQEKWREGEAERADWKVEREPIEQKG